MLRLVLYGDSSGIRMAYYGGEAARLKKIEG